MNEMLKKFFSTIISFGLPHYLPLASLLGSLLAIPFIIGWRLVCDLMPPIAHGLLLAYIVVMVVALFFVARLPHDQQPRFVADKVAGLFVTFAWIPLAVRVMLVGFCLFHIIRVLLPLIMKKLLNIDCERFGLFVATVVYTVLSGAVANGIVRIMLWTMQ